MSRRAGTTPTSAASRRARCRPTRRTSTRRACCSTTCSWSPQGRFLEAEMRAILAAGRHPSRNVDQNLADLRAQVAACAKGAQELAKMVAHFGLPVVRAYMRHVQDNAEEAVRRVLDVLKDGHFEYEMDSGAHDRRDDLDRQARSAARRSISPARARSSRPTSTRPPRCARRRCSTCSARSSTTRSR